MPGKTIATIYFYILSLIGVGLIVIGVFNIVNLIVNLTQYDKYPLKYGVDNCDLYPQDFRGVPVTKPMEDESVMLATPSAEEATKQKQICQTHADAERKQHLVDDIKNSIAFPIVGLILFLLHFPQAKKRSV
jgi:hypothetical protein